MNNVNEGLSDNSFIRGKLLSAHRSGTTLQCIEEFCRDVEVPEDDLGRELALLHNTSAFDVVELFSNIKKSESSFTIFSMLTVFEHMLPVIENDVTSTLWCIRHLAQETGSCTTNPFVSFLVQAPNRPAEALGIIKKTPELHDLLPATLIAGFRVSAPEYLEEAIQLTKADHPNVRKQAVDAIGRFEWAVENQPMEPVYVALENMLGSEDEDEILAAIAETGVNLMKQDLPETESERVMDIVNAAIGKGEDQSLHTAASLLAFGGAKIPEALTDKLLNHLSRVKPDNNALVSKIDHAMHRLIGAGIIDSTIRLLEYLIKERELKPEALNSTFRDIRGNATLLNKVSTKWLLGGDDSLCQAARFLVGIGRGANIPVDIDPTELDVTNSGQMVFLARKACGYFFMNPVSAVSMLLAGLHLAQTSEVRRKIGQLILNPLLINYPGKPRKYLKDRMESCSNEVQEILREVEEALDEYFDTLNGIDEIPELHPSQSEREAYHRFNSREMEASFKEAEKRSIFSALATKQVLLYGKTLISYFQDGQGSEHRQEIPLSGHSIEVEYPRMAHLDPVGLEYQLAMLRVERRNE
ncbi:hypothetical protein [Marinobacter piscensis]|uniref:hypothetical protein n=1 Tax=Marinobacter piscensis TaxID=1562308 RepID=UPI0011AA00E1|nr:hypothetical protein [Marinobacter piscensis]